MSEVEASLIGAPQSSVGPEAIVEDMNAEEIAPEQEAAPEVKVDPFAPKFAALSRKEKQVRQYEATVKQKEAELNKRLAELDGRSKETDGKLQSFEEQFKANPIQALKDRGLSLEDLIKIQMNDEQPTVEMQMKRMRSELEENMKKELDQLRNSSKEKEEAQAKAQYEQAVSSYKAEMASFIETNSEAYELIQANDATELMFEVAEEYYQKNKKVLDIKDVADVVEQHLEGEARKILELKKFKQTSPQAQKPAGKTAPTLSNAAAANVPSSGRKNLSNDDSLREAAKLIRWDD